MMETNTDRAKAPTLFNPLAGWEAASRWNAASLDWMARGFQQWVALVTTMPRAFVPPIAPAQPRSRDAGDARAAAQALESPLRATEAASDRAVATAEPRRTGSVSARPKAKTTAKKRSRG